MMQIGEVISFLEQKFPPAQQDGWDNSGIQVGDIHQEVKGVLVALDITEAVVQEAVKWSCNLIVTHHPLLFHATKRVTPEDYIHRSLMLAIKHDITIYSAHTSLDNDAEGVNHFWAQWMGVLNTRPILPSNESEDRQVGAGIIGELSEPISISDLVQRMKDFQPIQRISHSEILKEEIKTVAYCGGSGAFLMREAARQGADIFITGEAKYNDYYDARDLVTLMVIGHFESEELIKSLLYNVLCQKKGNFVVRCSSSCENPVKYI